MKSNKKVVVFGGCGFIGSNLCEELIKKKYKVIVFDKYINLLNKHISYVEGDILNSKAIDRVVKGAKFVFHFAGISDIEISNKNAFNTFSSNVLGTINILNSCVKNKVERLVFASSIYIYGNKGGFYKISKQTCESIIKEYSNKFNIKFTIIRFGSIYGPNSNNLNFIHRVIEDALNKGIMHRNSDGSEIRRYIHVSDAAQGVIKILKKEFSNKYVVLTGSQQMTIKEILEMINEILGKKIKIKYSKNHSSSHYEITPYCFEPVLGKKLNLESEIDLGEGIFDLISRISKDT